jgi:hypothetical protein
MRTAATSIAAAQKRKRANVGTPHNAIEVTRKRRKNRELNGRWQLSPATHSGEQPKL